MTIRRTVRRIIVVGTAVVATVALSTIALFAAWLHGYRIPGASGTTLMRLERFGSASQFGEPEEPVFVLLVGTDLRPGVTGARADALHVLSINPAAKQGAILNFPRDTCVSIPGVGTRKINEAHSNGGLDLTAATINDLVGLNVEFGMSVDFEGFFQLVDAIGGVEINVPTAMDDPYSGANLQPGPQRLDREQALAFSRDRHDFPQGDITRSGNQGLMIASAIAQLGREATSVADQFRLAAKVGKHAALKSMGVKDLFRLGRLADSVDPAQIKNVTIPVGGGGSCTGGLGLGGDAPSLFADFADDGVLQTH